MLMTTLHEDVRGDGDIVGDPLAIRSKDSPVDNPVVLDVLVVAVVVDC